jgi:2-keto-3-deoxy-L-rhamnonate aldolase RhmA
MSRIREQVLGGEVLLGTFVKTASHQIVEILGVAGLDYAVIDAEHAPFGWGELDRMVMGARAAGLPILIRVPSHEASFINGCLDLGADGVLIPHVRDAPGAAAVVAAAKYARERGFSPSPRAGSYGTADPSSYRREADSRSTVWCKIEDADALDALDAICGVPHVDCLFIGRADLALSLGVDGPSDPRLEAAVRQIAAAGRKHGVATGIFVRKTSEIPGLLDLGLSIFVCGSDQSLLMEQSRRIKADFAAAKKQVKVPQ